METKKRRKIERKQQQQKLRRMFDLYMWTQKYFLLQISTYVVDKKPLRSRVQNGRNGMYSQIKPSPDATQGTGTSPNPDQ